MRYGQEDDYNDDDESKFNDKRDFLDDEDDAEFEYEQIQRKLELQKQEIKVIEIGVRQQELRRLLLLDAINISQKSFWWNFLSFKTKISCISSFYEVFLSLVFGSVAEEIEEEILDNEEEI